MMLSLFLLIIFPVRFIFHFHYIFALFSQADLEQAVALSLALEEERLRLQQVEEKNCITPKRRADSFLLPYGSGDKDVDTKVRKVLTS